VEFGCTYIVAWSGPADSHLLANFHVRRDVSEYKIVVAVRAIGGIAEVVEERDEEYLDIELHCSEFWQVLRVV